MVLRLTRWWFIIPISLSVSNEVSTNTQEIEPNGKGKARYLRIIFMVYLEFISKSRLCKYLHCRWHSGVPKHQAATTPMSEIKILFVSLTLRMVEMCGIIGWTACYTLSHSQKACMPTTASQTTSVYTCTSRAREGNIDIYIARKRRKLSSSLCLWWENIDRSRYQIWCEVSWENSKSFSWKMDTNNSRKWGLFWTLYNWGIESNLWERYLSW
jgi:hypothetical protein